MSVAVSVIIPLYNEEGCVVPLFHRTREVMDAMGRSYEILMIDDGSKDRTYDFLKRLSRKHSDVLRVVRFRRNYGQTAAMAAGFDLARGEVIVTMDGDLQNDPRDIPFLLEKLDQGFDVVSGWRVDRKDASITRRFPSAVANGIISWLTGVRLHDYGCSLKAYRSRCIKGFKFYSDMHRFFPALVGRLTGARVTELSVRHWPRRTGTSKYGLSRTYRVLADMVTLQLVTRFLHRPIYWFGFCMMPFLVLGGILVLVPGLIFMKYGGGYTPVLLGTALLVFSVAFHFLTQGLLCEYVVRMGESPDKDRILFHPIAAGDRHV